MGCWNFTFWDNDECVSFLISLFQHMALMPMGPQVNLQVAFMTNQINDVKLIIRNTQDDYEEVQRIMTSITATSLQTAKASDPLFKEKFFSDYAFREEGLERIGLTKEYLWTLIHMHVGAPATVDELTSLAKAFHTRKKGGTWSIDPFLKSLSGSTDAELEEIRNQHAPFIRKGIIAYKERIKKGETLVPMKLAYLGPLVSQCMWFQYKLPTGLPPQAVWKHEEHVTSTFMELPKPDATFDRRKCGACGCLEASRSKPLLQCPCKCVFYCDKVCQVRFFDLFLLKRFASYNFFLTVFAKLNVNMQRKSWNEHRQLHKIRMDPKFHERELPKDPRTPEEIHAEAEEEVAKWRIP